MNSSVKTTPTIDDIKAIIRKQRELPADYEIGDGCDLADDLGVDSLDAIEIAMECEERFGVTIADSEIRRMTSPAAALAVVLECKGDAS
jgi:acyl carrier protein